MSNKNIAQIYISNPRVAIGDNDLFYIGQNGTVDGAMIGSVFKGLYPLRAGTGTSSIVGGTSATIASGDYSFSMGDNNVTPSIATGLFSFSYGSACENHGTHSFALGDLSYVFVSASFSFAFGLACTVTESYSFAIGNNAKANFAGSWVVGDSNINPIQDTGANQYRLTFNGGYYLQGSSLTASTQLALDANKKVISMPTYTLGEFAQGGVVFWLNPSRTSGLVAAIVDQDGGTGTEWYNNTFLLVGSFADGVYVGKDNTTGIILAQGAPIDSYAAERARAYNGGGLNDWYLPDRIELDLMWLIKSTINATAIANGGAAFDLSVYWTSNETSSNNACGQDMGTGVQSTANSKSNSLRVRAIRAF